MCLIIIIYIYIYLIIIYIYIYIIKVYCWIPSYIGVRGNHRADAAAKSALDLIPDKYNTPYADLKPQINNFLHKKWQQRWNRNSNNKLFQVKPFLGEWRPAFRKSRKEQVIITRLRIGHSRLSHSFILKQEQQPQCSTCQTPCTIKHVLLECKVFNNTRNPRGVMVKAMNCKIVVREFVLQSHYYVHFRANTLGKGMNPLILPPAMGK